ncbi:hypothetical protein [Thalassomonas sp. RHCl1]|uniref:hypothetical protein n=1 Tax=Thalassomonas sp. RHCl1 TaxID=2995320 RepID=UPI00248AACD3|nr:hypothetical protein [Thalassomonas sp. RHCl1]
MNLIFFEIFRVFVFLGSILLVFYLLHPVAVNYGLKVTGWGAFIFFLPLGFSPLWLFDKIVPAKCIKCGKASLYINPLSFYRVSFACKTCGAGVSPSIW